MPAGRKPKATEVKRRTGASKRRLPVPYSIGGRDFPVEPPDDLEPRAQELWAQLVPNLTDHNVLSRIDEAGMRMLCTQWARAEDARAALEADLANEQPELESRLDENRRLLQAIKRNVAQRLTAQTEGMEAAREALTIAVASGDRGDTFRALATLIEKIEQASVSPGELASIAKLETTLASLEEFIDLRGKGRKVALGSTGQIVEHPLLGSERAAAGLILRYGEHYAVTPVARARLGLAALEGATLKAELERELGPSTRKRKKTTAKKS